jgi:hypothetical protein
MERLEVVPEDWLKMARSDPVRYVEEIAILENEHGAKSYSGWYDENNPGDYVLIHAANETSATVYMSSDEWSEWYLRQIPYRKFYLQTDLGGAEMAASLFPVAHKGTVRYYRFLGTANLQSSLNPSSVEGLIWSFQEATSANGRLLEVECIGRINGAEIVSASTPFLNSVTSMVGVETKGEYRGHGLGRCAVGMLANRLLELGRIPVYAADISNKPSVRIASAFFAPYIDLEFLFVGPWHIDRPSGSPPDLPDSIFLS